MPQSAARAFQFYSTEGQPTFPCGNVQTCSPLLQADILASREGSDNMWVYIVAIPKTGQCIMRDWASPGMWKDDPKIVPTLRKHLFKRIEPFRGKAVEELTKKVRAGERKLKKAEESAAKSKKAAKRARNMLNAVLGKTDVVKASAKTAKKKEQVKRSKAKKSRAVTQLPEDEDDEEEDQDEDDEEEDQEDDEE